MVHKKFVSMFVEGGAGEAGERMVVLLPGRHPCQCLAVRHKLVGNCVDCGRIVCQQEGSGHCFFCGKIVTTQEEAELINSGSKAGQKLANKLNSLDWAPGAPTPPWSGKPRRRNQKGKGVEGEKEILVGCNKVVQMEVNKEEDYDEEEIEELPHTDAKTRLEDGLVKAMMQRDRLLHYDATTAKRTRVIDDELDYFVSEGSGSAAIWLDPETRARVAKRVEELRAQRHASRLDSSRICIDFATKTVFEEDSREMASKQLYSADSDVLSQNAQTKAATCSTTDGLYDPLLNVPTPQFLPDASHVMKSKGAAKNSISQTTNQPARVQDSEQLRIVDKGFCMSMHQPWASLLIRGVKTHEGRTWYSSHRGPLWIASAAHQPEENEIKELEAESLANGARLNDLPTSYPIGCLLGCINVDDVLPQKEYRLKYPNGLSATPYVFVCSDPRELLIKLPMAGQNKIYKLDPFVHTMAKTNLV